MNRQQKLDYAIKIMGNAAKCLRLGDLDKDGIANQIELSKIIREVKKYKIVD